MMTLCMLISSIMTLFVSYLPFRFKLMLVHYDIHHVLGTNVFISDISALFDFRLVPTSTVIMCNVVSCMVSRTICMPTQMLHTKTIVPYFPNG